MVKSPPKQTPIEKLIIWVGSVPSLILHTIMFIVFFLLSIFGIIQWSLMLLILTTIVSLEAIYMSIFIQMTVNRNTASLREVEEDIDEIQEDVEGLGEDVEEIGKDVDEIQEDIDEIQEDVEEIGKDVDEMQEDIEELSEEDSEDDKREEHQARSLEQLTTDMRRILDEIEALKKADK